MKRYDLNKNWEYLESNLQNPLMVGILQGWKKTDLPHDYATEKPRDPNAPNGPDEGYMPSAGLYCRKSFVVEPQAVGQRFWLEFEGVAGNAEVWVNKKLAAKHFNPYTSFWAEVTDLLHAGENEITVYTDDRAKPNSRWYVGCGIYRHVWLHMAAPVSVAPHGLRVTTTKLEGGCATLDIRAELTGRADSVTYTLVDGDGQTVASVTGGEQATLEVTGITPWTPETPALYTVRAAVTANGGTDVAEQRTGIRTIQVTSRQGLLLNGRPRTMKGGCIHHDLGILGAAEHDAADRRRIRLLKESGFDAVRLAHNPFGPSIFDACDELGMLCIEEAFDEWVLGRTSYGLHTTFELCWEKDLEDMIGRDYNHPCIVMWSTGNEVEERDGSADGFAWAKRLADKVRTLDASRPVSATACALFSEYGSRPADGTTGNQALNMAYDTFAEGRDLWGPGTAEYFAPVDVAGYNYKVARYAYDAEKYPDRVIYGSESYPRAALLSWQGAAENPNVIGDFVWTAWDYIGENGVGRWEVSDAPRPGAPGWPWLTAGCADIDLIGQKRPQSYYRDVLWGSTAAPRIFCLPPELVGKHLARLSWAWLPVQRSYTWPGDEGKEIEVNIYADADEVELFCNGKSMGKQPCTVEQEYIAVFRFPYQPGTLEAVSYKDGRETGRDTLTTAGPVAALRLTPDRPAIRADGDDLCFVLIEAVDEAGNPVPCAQGEVTVSLLGGGKLTALGTADPKPDRLLPFAGPACPLYEGRALAVVRSGAGAKGGLLTAALGSIKAELGIGFAPVETEVEPPVHECRPGAADLPLGELLHNPTARAVLAQVLGPMLDSPMIAQMHGMSLKKLLSMGGQALPPEVLARLDEACSC